MIPIHDLYVFGCFGSGHQLFRPDQSRALGAELYDVERACDGTPVDATVQVEGALVACTVPPGWSYVTWWDRQGDSRLGSHTGILARGTWSAEQLVTAARAHAPWAFRVPVQAAAVAVVADTLPVSAEAPAISAEPWGSGCHIALRERIADLDAAARADQSLRSVAAHAAGMQPASADDPEWPPRWEAIASVRIAEAEAERDAAMDEALRLRDLVRHQRGPLHDAEPLTDEEYADLAADAGAVARLRGYDELRRESRADVDKAVAAALEARAKQIDAKADAAFDGAAMYGAPFSQGKGEAALARREAYRVAARIVRGTP